MQGRWKKLRDNRVKKNTGSIEDSLKKAYKPVFVLTAAGFGGILLMAAGVELFLFTGGAARGDGIAGLFKAAFTGASAAAVFLLFHINGLKTRLDTARPGIYISRIFYYDVITVIVCEVPAVLGFILFILTGSRQDFYLHAVLSVVFFLFFRPKFRSWERVLRRPN